MLGLPFKFKKVKLMGLSIRILLIKQIGEIRRNKLLAKIYNQITKKIVKENKSLEKLKT